MHLAYLIFSRLLSFIATAKKKKHYQAETVTSKLEMAEEPLILGKIINQYSIIFLN